MRLDDAFHLELTAGCPNPVLVDLIRQFMWRTRRYELGFMRQSAPMSGAVAAHGRIVAALEAGKLDVAVQELEGNLTRGQEPILEWLAQRDAAKGDGG